MADLAKMSHGKLVEVAERLQKSKLRDYAKKRAERGPKAMVETAMAAVGGAAGGAAAAKWPSIRNSPINGGMAAGAATIAAGFFIGGSEGDAILDAGQGALAAGIGIAVYNHMK